MMNCVKDTNKKKQLVPTIQGVKKVLGRPKYVFSVFILEIKTRHIFIMHKNTIKFVDKFKCCIF